MQVRTGTAPSGEIGIHYEDMGDPGDPAVVLIMGLGAQMIFWRTGFCEKLINQGLRVIRFDNRDVGLSGKLPGHHSGAPLLPRMARSFVGLASRRPTRSRTWPTTRPRCSTTSTSTGRMWSVRRWAA